MENGERADHKDKINRSSAFTSSIFLIKNGITKAQPKRINLGRKHIPKKKKKSMTSGLSSPQALFLDTAAKEVCKVLSCVHMSMGPNHSKYWVSL